MYIAAVTDLVFALSVGDDERFSNGSSISLSLRECTVHIQYNTREYSSALYCTVQYSILVLITVQYSTAGKNSALYS